MKEKAASGSVHISFSVDISGFSQPSDLYPPRWPDNLYIWAEFITLNLYFLFKEIIVNIIYIEAKRYILHFF